MARITYADKIALNVNPEIADINKVKDTDMNEIKNAINSNETKILIAVSDTAPAECSTGDVYYNTTTNLLYTATGTNTWGSTGVAPTENTIYILFGNQTAYAYDGTTLISVGGGSGDLIMVNEEPTEDTKLYIEDEDLEPQGLEIANEYNTANNMAYSCDYINDCETYSTDEVKTNKVWIDGKPVYRKCASFSSQNAMTQKSNLTMINILDISDIVLVSGYWEDAFFHGITNPLCTIGVSGSAYDTTYYKNNNVLNLNFPNGSAGAISGKIIAEYTKTTD